MMYLIKMAFRNLQRNKRRSVLAITSVCLSIALVMFLQMFITSFVNSIIKNSVKNDSGHIRISTEEFVNRKRFMPVTQNIQNPKSIIKAINKNDEIAKEVDFISERISFPLVAENKGHNKSVLVQAGDPKHEKKLLMLNDSITEGSYIKEKRDVIIGEGVAKDLKLKVGDKVRTLTTGSDYGLNIYTFKVRGIFKTGVNSLDNKLFHISISDAKNWLNAGDSVQQIIVMLKNYDKAEPVAKKIKALLSEKGFEGIDVTPWQNAGGFASTIQMAIGIYNFMYFIVALLGAFIITNIMMMVVLERKREIGIIKSMGVSQNEVLFLFLFEGMTLGIIGSVLGVILGALSGLYFAIEGMDWSSMMADLNYPMDNVIYFEYSPIAMIGVMFLGITVSSLISALPARHAAKMKAVDAIKSV